METLVSLSQWRVVTLATARGRRAISFLLVILVEKNPRKENGHIWVLGVEGANEKKRIRGSTMRDEAPKIPADDTVPRRSCS